MKNADTIATCLQEKGFKIVSGGTSNHLMLVDTFVSYGVTGKQAEHALEVVGLSANKNMVPYDTRPPMNPSGIRIGTPAATTRGMGTQEMKEIADIFSQAIQNHDNEAHLETQRQRVLELCAKFPIYK